MVGDAFLSAAIVRRAEEAKRALDARLEDLEKRELRLKIGYNF